jgi:hypothetical protein
MNAVGWLGAGVAPVAVAAASEKFGMAACLSATSAIYLLCGVLLLAGIAGFSGVRNQESISRIPDS